MRWFSRPSHARLAVMLLPVLAACGGDGSNAPQPTEFTVAMVTSAVTARQGENVLLNVRATITSGPASEFTFSATGAPTGVTITFPPGPLPAPTLGSATATMAVQVGTTVAPGIYTITVTATSKAGVAKTTAASLTVVLPPSYTIAVTPTSQTVNQNGTGGAVVTLTRTNFAAPVLLSIEDQPPGVSGVFTPSQVTGTTSGLQLTVGPTVVLGTYPVTVRAQSSGMTDRTATFNLTVSAEPSFALSVAPTALTITTGASATANVTLVRTNYGDGVNFAFDAPHPGITGSFVPGATGGNASVLTVAVAQNVPAGAYTATVRANGTGVTERTATLTVNVALPAPAYALTATPAALTVQGGQSGTSAIAIARTNFTGAVALALDAPPAGITATFAPASTTTSASQLTLSVATSVAAGTYNLTARGVATGLADRTLPITLTVTAAPQSITLSAAPESVSVFQGAQVSTTVAIARNNFAGDVTFSASAPTGLAVSFAPNPATGTSSVMTVTANATAPAGRHVVTLTGAGTGITAATLQVPVNVTAAGTGSLSFTFCDPARTPVFFAVQDSTGTWTPVTPVTAGTVSKYYFDLVSDRGGVAFITKRVVTTPRVASGFSLRRNRLLQTFALQQQRDAVRVSSRQATLSRTLAFAGNVDVYDTFVYFLAKSEMSALGQDLCTTVVDTKTNLVNVAGVGAGQVATLSMGGVSQSFVGGATTSPLTFTGVPSRAVDLVGTRFSASEGFEKGLVLRNLNVANGGTLGTVADFEGANAFVPAVATANIANSLAQTLVLNSVFFTGNGQAGLFGLDESPSTASSRLWSGVPASKFLSGDVHGLLAIATPTGGGANDFRSLLQYVGPVANTNLAMGPEMDLIAVTPIGSFGDSRYRVQANTLPQGIRNAVELFVNLPTATGNSYRLVATGQWLTNSAQLQGFDLSMPALAALTGFPTASRLSAGTNDLRVSGLGWTGTGIVAPRPQAGDQLRIGARGITVVVP
ncbi:MAG: hypothetical protein IT361_05245 [Gemmatimonadaceae bacterium]|nr:hypothetical protein [Gemmatimonadaceae bacterium]